MRRDIDIALLRAFVAVVESGSVTGAAALLNLTQAAVSQQLKRLEELFGTALFERQHKRLTVAPSGERLMAHAQRMIALNDEVWTSISAPAYEGEVRLGVPHDLVGPYLPPVLRRFDKAWPRVRVTLACLNTQVLLGMLRKGEVDLTLTTEQTCRANGETLLEDDLAWIGAMNGTAHLREPLPLSLGDRSCEFRSCTLNGLRDVGLDWRPVCEISSMEALFASIEADVAVGAFLRSTIPSHLKVIEDARLPRLPKFQINMYMAPGRPNDIAEELARHIRQEFSGRFRRPQRLDADGKARRKLPPAIALAE
jgi:DNA-binding transcriptional LysR family regulator